MESIGIFLMLHMGSGLISGLYVIGRPNFDKALDEAIKQTRFPYPDLVRNKRNLLILFVLFGVFSAAATLKKLVSKR